MFLTTTKMKALHRILIMAIPLLCPSVRAFQSVGLVTRRISAAMVSSSAACNQMNSNQNQRQRSIMHRQCRHSCCTSILLRQPHPRVGQRTIMMSSDDQADDLLFTYTTLDTVDTTPISESNSISISACQRDLAHVLQTIEHAAYSAGQIALSTAGKIAVKTSKANTRDLVTESDIECQRLIKEIILKEFPDDVFLGEEDIDLSVDSSSASSEALVGALGMAESGTEDRLLFVVDPIDGTTNFQAGLPIYAMSIGVVSLAGNTPEVVAGVIYNPTLGEMLSAVKGRGCYLNNKRIKSKTDPDNTQRKPRESVLGESLINIGFPISKESTLLASSRAVTALATKVRGIRMVACASQAMAWVAQSKFASYFSWDLNAWDVAAGMVIIEEAGGFVSKFDGMKADISTRDMIMTCPPEVSGEDGLLRDELIQVLKDNDCLEY